MSDRRRKLTDLQKDIIIARQGGVCPGLPGFGIICGKPVTRDTAEFDHADQRVFTKSDHIDEFQALCRGERTSCASIKTNGKPGAGSAGSDANKRVKVRRAERRRTVSAYRMAVKAGGIDHAARLYPEIHRVMERKRRFADKRKLQRRGFKKVGRRSL